MIALNDIKRIYFIGIGGIGMSALARFFAHRGAAVSGYDRTNTPLTQQLEAEGIVVVYDEDISLADPEAQIVVYTPAIPSSHAQLEWYRRQGYTLLKRSEVLGIITRGSFNICVAGTHGKTSISTMIAHILRHTRYGCNAFLGGVSANYHTNFWASDNSVCVIEADEYDRSFLTLHPDIAVVSSMDPDHLDIYHTTEAMEEAFVTFASQTKPDGLLLRHQRLQRLDEAGVSRRWRYSLLAAQDIAADHGNLNAVAIQEGACATSSSMPDVYISRCELAGHTYRFDAVVAGETLTGFELKVGGTHNVENMLAAIAIARLLQIDVDAIREAVAAYRGVRRRFEYAYIQPGGGIVYIDDYAHHPGELEVLISSLEQLYPGRRITLLFQPHLYSRTADFAAGFAHQLRRVHQAVLLPIYPAREAPLPGVSSALIAQDVPGIWMMEKEKVLDWLDSYEPDILVTAGAGDIDTLVSAIAERLAAKYGIEKEK